MIFSEVVKKRLFIIFFFVYIFFGGIGFTSCNTSDKLTIDKGTRISIIGNNLGARMMHYGFFETQIQLTFPDRLLVIRNLCDAGNTLGFRPHSGRNEPWAFQGLLNFKMHWHRIGE